MVVLNDMQTEVSDYCVVRQGEGKSRCVFRAGFRNLMHSVSEELATKSEQMEPVGRPRATCRRC